MLPAGVEIKLGLGGRGEGEVSVDGVRLRGKSGPGGDEDADGMWRVGREITIKGEVAEKDEHGKVREKGWGVPVVVDAERGGDGGWVGGLNGLLKFNYPFGEDG